MPLREIGALREWIDPERPSRSAQRVARHFLAEVGVESWRYPSVPIPELSDQPTSEVRRAELDVEGEQRPVIIWYRHLYANDMVDVVAITNR